MCKYSAKITANTNLEYVRPSSQSLLWHTADCSAKNHTSELKVRVWHAADCGAGVQNLFPSFRSSLKSLQIFDERSSFTSALSKRAMHGSAVSCKLKNTKTLSSGKTGKCMKKGKYFKKPKNKHCMMLVFVSEVARTQKASQEKHTAVGLPGKQETNR